MTTSQTPLAESFTDLVPIKCLCAFTSDEGQTLDDLKTHFMELAAYVENLKQEGFTLEAHPDPTWLVFSHHNRSVFEKYFEVWEDPDEEDEQDVNE